ncbi:MAG: phosphate acyltransferase PlsX [Gemmataceae bacterium]|nr:phosphate acyltransferase PlsX [Gemmataceae bacterium]
MRVALDAMGGDLAPGPIVAGAVQAVQADADLTVVLVGDQDRIAPLLPTGPERSRLELFHCTQAVAMDDKPTIHRSKPDNSIKHCWELLATDRVSGLVSAGNTGAMVAGGHFMKRFLPGVERPGIATVYPTEKGPLVLLDVGANIAAKPEHLYQYAIMGGVYSRHVLGVASPRIALLNIGEEEGKGNDLAKEAYPLLKRLPAFAGNLEGREFHKGMADVVVCDGFVGNVLLKYSEGVFAYLLRAVQQELAAHVGADKLGPALRALGARYDYAEYGGAPLLGINGACVICHGSSGDRAIRNALLKAAVPYVRADVNGLIVKELEANPLPAKA